MRKLKEISYEVENGIVVKIPINKLKCRLMEHIGEMFMGEKLTADSAIHYANVANHVGNRSFIPYKPQNNAKVSVFEKIKDIDRMKKENILKAIKSNCQLFVDDNYEKLEDKTKEYVIGQLTFYLSLLAEEEIMDIENLTNKYFILHTDEQS